MPLVLLPMFMGCVDHLPSSVIIYSFARYNLKNKKLFILTQRTVLTRKKLLFNIEIDFNTYNINGIIRRKVF